MGARRPAIVAAFAVLLVGILGGVAAAQEPYPPTVDAVALEIGVSCDADAIALSYTLDAPQSVRGDDSTPTVSFTDEAGDDYAYPGMLDTRQTLRWPSEQTSGDAPAFPGYVSRDGVYRATGVEDTLLVRFDFDNGETVSATVDLPGEVLDCEDGEAPERPEEPAAPAEAPELEGVAIGEDDAPAPPAEERELEGVAIGGAAPPPTQVLGVTLAVTGAELLLLVLLGVTLLGTGTWLVRRRRGSDPVT